MTEIDGGDLSLAELKADNRRLRRLLDQRDAPGELRHRLRNTVGLLRTIIRKSAESQRDLERYVGHTEDRLDAVARAQAAADDHGVVEIHSLIAEELHHYGASEGERVFLSGPQVELQPRAGQVLALAIHELAVNAVEHGALVGNSGVIEIEWAVTAEEGDPALTLTWQERGVTGVSEPARQGFGTEVLTRMLPYQLKAEATLTFASTGLRCRLRFPLPVEVGSVVNN